MKKPLVDIYPQYAACREAANETNDCTVVSLAFLMDWRYEKARTAMRVAGGRSERKPASLHAATSIMPQMDQILGICPDKGISLAEFCQAHPRGRYWVAVTGHALAVVNGQIHDHSHKPRRRVRAAWRVNHQPVLRLEHHAT